MQRMTLSARPDLSCAAAGRPSVFMFGMFGGGQQQQEPEYDDDSCTVMKLQVGVFGDISKWQRDLARLSTLYDTDEEGGLHSILMEVLQMLLRNTEYVAYAASGGKMFEYIEEAESKFNEVSFEERAKFREETLVNVDGRSVRGGSGPASTGDKDLDQWMCITLVLAIERGFKFPKINTLTDLKKAIKYLAGVTEDELLAFELMWTPENEGDSYSKDELLTDYPTMVTLA